MGHFDVSALTPVPDNPGVARSAPGPMIDQLDAIFAFSSDSVPVIEMQCTGGEIINQAKHSKLTALVDSHPEWTDEQAIKAMKEADANFGPDARDSVQRNLPFERLEPIIGKIHMTSLYFQVRNGANPPQAMLSWYADFTAKKAGKETRYYLAIEPFAAHVYLLQPKRG